MKIQQHGDFARVYRYFYKNYYTGYSSIERHEHTLEFAVRYMNYSLNKDLVRQLRG